MAVQACVKANMIEEMDEDEPLVFKRTSTESKQNRLNSEKPTTASQRKDGPSGKQAIVQSSASQKDKTDPSAKTCHMRSPLSNSLASPSGTTSSPRKDRPSGKQVTAQNPVSQKDKSNPSAKTSHVRPPLSNSSASPSSSKATIVKSPSSTSYKVSLSPEQSKNLRKENPILGKEDQILSEATVKPDAEDSEDEKPLSARVSKGKTIVGKEAKTSSKGTSEPNNHAGDSEDEKPISGLLTKEIKADDKEKKTANKNNAELNKDLEDSEDEKPIGFRLNSSTPVSSSSQKSKIDLKRSGEELNDEKPNLPIKYYGMTSGVKSHGNGNKPLSSKLQQNGSASKDEQRKPSPLINKRPLDKVNSSSQSSSKKLKLSDASPSLKNKAPTKKSDSDESEEYTPEKNNSSTLASKSSSGKLKVNNVSSFKRTTTNVKRVETKLKYSQSTKMSPKSGDGKKWTTLVHNGVIFPPPYKPHGVKMLYKGKPVDLTPEQEEVATMFAVMMETDYAQKEVFIKNFMNDWRRVLGKTHVIQKFEDCDFRPIYEWHQSEKEKKKLISTEEKKAIKEEKMSLEEKYMWATVDGVKEKVGNFRVEPPGLFRGRGEHPKMGKLKRRIRPSDITINIGKGVPIPECPIAGERWKEVKHDNTVTWLAFWTDPINVKEFKYVFLAASSSLKGQSDKEKYEKARTLKDYIEGIRLSYAKGFLSKDIAKQQIAVATYLIDKLALRAGNEKDDDEADTVGCCTLKVENVKLIPPNKLEFDFLGKDSIRYNNVVEVELPVYKAITQFQKGKREGDDLFDELDTSKLNAHLKELMPGLTAKVFRTYNASITLDEMLARDTKGGDVAEKISVYNSANKEVAIICNHQRTISKSHASQISRLDEKIDELKAIMDELNTDLERAKKGKPPLKDKDGKQKKSLTPEVLQRKMDQTKAKIDKMERDKHTKEDLKTVALGTSKINYLDPRISVAWCKRHEVPIEKIFNKSLLAKFTWAMDCEPGFRF